MQTIDGSQGEGGGQILRSSLALALVTGQAVRIERIRAGRRKPGLMRQHLTAVQAAAAIGAAEVEGAELRASELTFRPGRVTPGEYHFAVGTAGSATLVLQTVLPALLIASGPSRLTLDGGTHNPFAPPFDFLQRAFLPLLNRMGPTVEATLERPGFYPAGGGRFTVTVDPVPKLEPLELRERGAVLRRLARARVAGVSKRVAQRELSTVSEGLGWQGEELVVEQVRNSAGPGNVLTLEIESAHVTEVVSAFGQRGVPAERVAGQAVKQARRYLAADVPVGEHLADQLLVPLALAGAGSFRLLKPTRHTQTNIEVLRALTGVEVRCTKLGRDDWVVEVS